MNTYFYEFLLKIEKAELQVSLLPENCIEESLQMMSLLNETLKEFKNFVLNNGFDSPEEEKTFFRDIKPQVQGKWLFYHQVYQWELMAEFPFEHNQ